jgi:hypothetical protein
MWRHLLDSHSVTHDTAIAPSGVLFVGVPRTQLAGDVQRCFEERGVEVHCAADVYRALARIGKQCPAAVVVAVDWLANDELEFFEILARRHRNVRAFVVGHQRAGSKLSRAVGYGASVLASPIAVVDQVGVCPAPATAPAAPPARSRGVDVQEKQPEFASAHNVFDAELDRRLQELVESGGASAEVAAAPVEAPEPAGPEATPLRLAELDTAEDRTYEVIAEDVPPVSGPGVEDIDITRPVRVPWRRYDGAPARTPPRIRPPEPPADGADAPLLTPEELDALLGDDDSANGSDWGSRK